MDISIGFLLVHICMTCTMQTKKVKPNMMWPPQGLLWLIHLGFGLCCQVLTQHGHPPGMWCLVWHHSINYALLWLYTWYMAHTQWHHFTNKWVGFALLLHILASSICSTKPNIIIDCLGLHDGVSYMYFNPSTIAPLHFRILSHTHFLLSTQMHHS